MLLFSTLLEINDTMTKDSFIQLVLEWNQGSPHEENIIQGIEWNPIARCKDTANP